MTARALLSILRLSQALARLRFRCGVEKGEESVKVYVICCGLKHGNI
jgi:DNA replicative helicase MCM subunit Mcm2 (Cdc46/Mcm family)